MDDSITIGPLSCPPHQPCTRGEGESFKLDRLSRLDGRPGPFTVIPSGESNSSLSSSASLHRHGAATSPLIQHSRLRRLFSPLEKARLLRLFRRPHRRRKGATDSAEIGPESPTSTAELSSYTDGGEKGEFGFVPRVIFDQPDLRFDDTFPVPSFSRPRNVSKPYHRATDSTPEWANRCPWGDSDYGGGQFPYHTPADGAMSANPFGDGHQETQFDASAPTAPDGTTTVQPDNDEVSHSAPTSSRRFACPLSKHNPDRYLSVDGACTTRFGFLEVKKATEHVKQVHLHNYRDRCRHCGPNRQRTKPDCPIYNSRINDRELPEFLTPRQEQALFEYRAARGNEPPSQWHDLYLTLYPGHGKPYPYYDYLTPSHRLDETIERLVQERLAERSGTQEPACPTTQSVSPGQHPALLGLLPDDEFSHYGYIPPDYPSCANSASDEQAQLLLSNPMSPYSPGPTGVHGYQQHGMTRSDYGTGSHQGSHGYPPLLPETPLDTQSPDAERLQPHLSFSEVTCGLGIGVGETSNPQHHCHGLSCQCRPSRAYFNSNHPL